MKTNLLKLTFLVLGLWMLHFTCLGQSPQYNFKHRFGFGYDSYVNADLSLKSGYVHYVLNPEDRWSWHYSVSFGTTQNGKFYGHFPLGAFIGIYFLANSDGGSNELLTTLAVLSFIAPEGVSYNIPLNDKMKVSPYLNFNSIEFYHNDKDEERVMPSFGFGTRVSYLIHPNFGVSFGLGTKIIAAEGWGIQTGVGLFYQY